MLKEREYNREGNDCLIYVKKILTEFNRKYIVIKITYYAGWNESDNDYENIEFEDENKAIKYFNAN